MVERTITDLEYDINLVDKAEASSRGPTPTLKEVLIAGKMLSNSIAY